MLIKRPRADGTVDVTFRMALEGVARLSLLGDFNHWNAAAHPLTPAAHGVWSVTLRLPPGEYRYRYLANGNEWLNDPEADAYAANEFGSENSVLRVEAVAREAAGAAPAPHQKRAAKAKAKREASAAPRKRAPRQKSGK